MIEKTYIDERGYRRFNNSHRLVHRWIAEKEIYNPNKDDYKYSFSKYQVHHINGNRLDNRPHNLQILTEKEHKRIHRVEEMKEQRRIAEEKVKAREENAKKEVQPKKYHCESCGREIKQSGNCLPCNRKLKKEREERAEHYRINLQKFAVFVVIVTCIVAGIFGLISLIEESSQTCYFKDFSYDELNPDISRKLGFFDYYGKGEVQIRNKEAQSGTFTVEFFFSVNGKSFTRSVSHLIDAYSVGTFEAEIDIKREDSFNGYYVVTPPTIEVCD